MYVYSKWHCYYLFVWCKDNNNKWNRSKKVQKTNINTQYLACLHGLCRVVTDEDVIKVLNVGYVGKEENVWIVGYCVHHFDHKRKHHAELCSVQITDDITADDAATVLTFGLLLSRLSRVQTSLTLLSLSSTFDRRQKSVLSRQQHHQLVGIAFVFSPWQNLSKLGSAHLA